jgi:preprotein translocase subunit SecF
MGIQFIPHDVKIDFIGKRWWTFAVSIAVVVFAIAGVFSKGLHYGIDFAGGLMIEIRTPVAADINDIRTKVNALNLGESSIQTIGSQSDIMIRLQQQPGGDQAQQVALNKIKDALGHHVEYRSVQSVGPKAGSELIEKGIWAVIWALIAMMIYIWVRFDWKFGICAIFALLHDCFAIMAMYVFTGMEFGTSAIVAILTTAGYSINDTVVVYDRIRENLRKYKKMALPELINLSINETLSRTILTAGTTLLSLLALYLFGGPVIAAYSFPILCGITVGTFSSICLASPLLLYFGTDQRKSTEEAQPA